MPHHRILPLLIVGAAACLPLAACGSDDPETAATPSTLPTTTTAPAPDGSAPDRSASEQAAAPGNGDRGGDRAPAAGDEPAARSADGDAAATSQRERSGRAADGARTTKGGGSSSRGSSSTSKRKDGARSGSDGTPPAPEVPRALEEYAAGGAPATPDQAAEVRASMLAFQEALAAQDAAKACSYTLGLPAKSDPSKPTPSCETLIQGSKMAPPTDQDREMIRSAKITIDGDRAAIEMGTAGLPMPFRKVDGRWRIDYGTLLGLDGAAG